MTAGQYSAIGSQATVLMIMEESYALVKGFPTAAPYVQYGTPAFKAGQVVKLNTDGTVSLVTATTDVPFGVVASAWERDDSPNVRVYTPFSVIYGAAICDGTLADGDEVACSGVNADGIPKFKTAGVGDNVCGRCLVGNTTGLAAQVGFYRVPGASVGGGGSAVAGDVALLTDSTGGTSGGNTMGVITTGTPADLAAQAAINTQIRNDLATLTAKFNALRASLVTAGLMA